MCFCSILSQRSKFKHSSNLGNPSISVWHQAHNSCQKKKHIFAYDETFAKKKKKKKVSSFVTTSKDWRVISGYPLPEVPINPLFKIFLIWLWNQLTKGKFLSSSLLCLKGIKSEGEIGRQYTSWRHKSHSGTLPSLASLHCSCVTLTPPYG